MREKCVIGCGEPVMDLKHLPDACSLQAYT